MSQVQEEEEEEEEEQQQQHCDVKTAIARSLKKAPTTSPPKTAPHANTNAAPCGLLFLPPPPPPPLRDCSRLPNEGVTAVTIWWSAPTTCLVPQKSV